MTGQSVAEFVFASFLVVISPGPATLFVMRRRPIAAVRAVAGIILGDIILISLSALGFAAMVDQWPAIATALKLAGACYVVWIGVGLLKAANGKSEPERDGPDFVGGLLVTLSNPKAIIFFAAFFPLFLSPGQFGLISFARLGLLFELVNILYFASLIFLMQLVVHRINGRWGAIVRRASGLGLIAVAALIIIRSLLIED